MQRSANAWIGDVMKVTEEIFFENGDFRSIAEAYFLPLNMVSAIKFIDGNPQATQELLAEEHALQILIDHEPFSITMCTPACTKELAVGLLFTEGIIQQAVDVISVFAADGVVDLKLQNYKPVQQSKRSLMSNASCGVCGKVELDEVFLKESVVKPPAKKLSVALIPTLLQNMQQHQSAFEKTGGTHSAALFTIEGKLLSVHEDVGRHNAVDKVIGEMVLKDELASAELLVVSGRVSYEIVTKCVRADIPFLLAVSAPSSMAVKLCEEKGITLIAFCRENRATVYSHTQAVAGLKHQSLTLS